MSKTPPLDDSDTLLAHAGFLRGLARSLLFDRASADDVAQQALLAALKRGVGVTSAPAGFSLRGWLAGLVRNLVRQGTREEARRTARERAAARPEATPSAADTTARLELMQRVVGAVQQLEEPYRTAVLLRFFDGLPPRAIARRLNVPVETVRTRIKRGLEQLRRRLDAGHGGDRIAWGALLLPTALSSGKGIVAGALAGTAAQWIVMHGIGALAMSTNAKVMTGAGVALIATIVLVSVNRSDDVIDGAPAPARAPVESPAPAEAPPPEASIPVERATAQRLEERTSTAETADPLATFLIRGSTRLADGSTHGGLHVKLRLFDGYETEGEAPVETQLASDAAGAFVWALRPPKGTVTILARGVEEGYLSGEERLLILSGDSPGTLDVSFALLDATVEGRVMDERGAPLPDAKVFNWYGVPTAECDEHGEFRVGVPSSHGRWDLDASAPGFAEARQTAILKGPGSTTSVEFRLRPDFTIHGRIRKSRRGREAELDQFVLQRHDERRRRELRHALARPAGAGDRDPSRRASRIRAEDRSAAFGRTRHDAGHRAEARHARRRRGARPGRGAGARRGAVARRDAILFRRAQRVLA
jgi:RNA polymerase sigma-70 factor (ECF subfamily)